MNHVEQAKRALKALLADRLPQKLQLADAAGNDDGLAPPVHTPPPQAIYCTNKSALETHPVIELGATISEPIADSTAQVYRHRVVAAITVAGDDEQTLTTQTERYIWAIRQVARDTVFNPPIGTGPVDSGVEQYASVNHPQGSEIPFVAGGFIELFIETVE